ncbi:MAG: transcription termination factor NusA [Candidatus Marinimicrobia bacterium]|nr:transcription termination factor NusA [Candidatus Neomarinimicrobiota bacterium]
MIDKEVIEQLIREKNIDKNLLSEIIQKIFINLIERKYGDASNFDVIVNMDKGEIEIYHQKSIVDKVTDEVNEIDIKEAKKVEPDLDIGDTYIEIVNPESFGRRLINLAKQRLIQEIVKVEKHTIFEEYKKKIGQIVSGDIRQIKRDAVYIYIGKAELKLPREEQIPGERYRRGREIRVLIKDAVMGKAGPEIIASRSDPQFLIKLFENEVPEIADGTVEIVAVARHPGDRSKVVVKSNNKRVDAVGACVGIKGSRIQAIVRELNNEKIDIINYSTEPEVLITRALSPARPYVLEIDEEKKTALAVFEDEEIPVAIGKNGQNIKLASEVTGYNIDAIKRSEYELTTSEIIYLEDIENLSEHAWKLLYSVGIETADEFLDTPREELLKINGIGEKTLEKITAIIQEAVEKRKKELEEARKKAEEGVVSSEEATAMEEEAEKEKEFEFSEEEIKKYLDDYQKDSDNK